MGVKKFGRLRRYAAIAYALVVVGVIAYLSHRIWKRAQYSTATRSLVTSCSREPAALDDTTRYHHVNAPCDRFVDRNVIDDGALKALEYEVEISMNSLGFRNDEYAVEKPPGVTRLILLGDSFVYGLGVRHEETFYKRLEAKLNAVGQRRYEVWNIAAVSWATHVQRRVVEGPLLRFSPDLVVLFFDDSDYYDDEAYRRLQGPDGKFPAQTDMDRFWKLRGRVMEEAFRLAAATDGGPAADAATSDDAGAPGWPSYTELQDTSAAHIEAMAEALRKAKVPFLVVNYPYPKFKPSYESKYLQPFYDSLESKKIARVGLYELFPLATRSRFYFGANRHWNAAGSKRVADHLFQILPKRFPGLFDNAP